VLDEAAKLTGWRLPLKAEPLAKIIQSFPVVLIIVIELKIGVFQHNPRRAARADGAKECTLSSLFEMTATTFSRDRAGLCSPLLGFAEVSAGD
jgi:hypothetical protein